MNKKLILIALATAFVVSCKDKEQKASDGTTAATEQAVEVEEIAPCDTFSYRGFTNLGNILGGKDVDSTFMPQVTETSAYAKHKEALASMFEPYKTRAMEPIHEWVEENIKETVDTVFYPFAGADFNYMSCFFPECRFCMLIGRERGGRLPLTTPSSVSKATQVLNMLRSSIGTNLRSSFFCTNSMATDFNSEVEGTAPVVMMFVVLHGFEIVNVNGITTDSIGNIIYTDPENVWAHSLEKDIEDGFEIMYRKPGEKGVRKICYLKGDLSDGGIGKTYLDAMIDRYFNGQVTMLKAASYLMHESYFSKIREAILRNSRMIINPPSGIPYLSFDKNVWDLELWGNYVGPIALFTKPQQNELKEAYRNLEVKRPLKFSYDYHRSASFILARKK